MILLDILVWSLANDTQQLSASIIDAVDAAMAQKEAFVSAATFWELALLRRKRSDDLMSLPPPEKIHSKVIDRGLVEIPISGSLWVEAVGLMDKGFHKDPADQLIVATAIQHEHQLLTKDSQIRGWAEKTGRVALFAHESVG